MLPKVYIETSFVSYLTARPSRDLVIAGHQESTREWWETCRARFELYTSQIVVEEAKAGDVSAAEERVDVLATTTLLAVTPEAFSLAEKLVQSLAVPVKASVDALHIGIAAFHSVDYLLTWNCKHLANAMLRTSIELVCRQNGFRAQLSARRSSC